MRRPSSTTVTALAAAVAIAAAALAGLTAASVADARAAGPVAQVNDRARYAAILQSVTDGVQDVLSYNYKHLDQDMARAEPLLTPAYREQYDRLMEQGVRDTATKVHAITTAQVTAAGVTEASADRAVVLVFVNQISTNTNITAPRLDQPKVQVTVVHSGDQWLIDKLQPL